MITACRFLRVFAALCVLAVPNCTQAAPPTVTYLLPAGAQRGTTAAVSAGGTFERWPVQAWTDGKGVEVKAAKDKGKLSVTVAADAAPGVYWVRLYDEQGASALRPFVVGTLPEVQEQEPNDDPAKPQVLEAASVTVNGRLEKAGDVDGYAVKLRKGQTLVASMDANRVLGSPMDGVLQVVSAAGFVLAQNNDDHGLDPQIVFTAPADGTFVVRAFAFPAEPDSTIRFAGGDNYVYRLTLTTGGFADHAFPLAVPHDNPSEVQLVGWNIPDAAKRVPVPRRDGPGTVTVAHAQVANTAAVRLEPHATIAEVEPNDRQHPQEIELPATVSGRIEPRGDVDVFRFLAKKGQKLLFQAEAQALGSPLDAVLRLTNAAGKTLAEVDDPGSRRSSERDPELAFTVPQDGAFLVELRDLHGSGSFRHVYRIRATVAEPDFALTLAADQFVLTPGKLLEVPVTLTLRNGFVGTVEVTAEGLPAGVTATSVKATSGGAVKLQLDAGSGPAAGAFRVVGKADSLARTATVPVAGPNAVTAPPWLTVLKAAEPKK